MSFKYASHHPTCPDQPCIAANNFSAKAFSGYRFTHNPPLATDLLPPAVLAGPKPTDRCERYALSFFETLRAAQNRFSQLNKKFDAVARYGGFICQFSISANDGESSNTCTISGHIDLHEYVGCNLINGQISITIAQSQIGGTNATP